MSEKQIKELMLKFLKRNYPIARVKDKLRFKRGIVLDGGDVFFLSDKNSHLALQKRLLDILNTVFSCETKVNYDVLKTFLKLS